MSQQHRLGLARWKKWSEYEFAITDSRDGFFLGGCGLNHINRAHQIANLGYWARSSRAKQDIATAAVLLVARFGFDELKLRLLLRSIIRLVSVWRRKQVLREKES
jgi:RimJ/RimL family protein N-acetyltransferase